MTPAALLHLVSRVPSHPGILFFTDATALPPEKTELPDGGQLVELANRVYLPSDAASWTPAIIDAACTTMRTCKLNDYNADTILPVLMELDIAQADFAAFCDACGYGRPAFWFGTSSETKPRSFAGRPSVMRAIEEEMRRRARARQLAPKLRDEAQALHAWAKENIDKSKQLPKPRAIENTLRDIYRQLRSGTEA